MCSATVFALSRICMKYYLSLKLILRSEMIFNVIFVLAVAISLCYLCSGADTQVYEYGNYDPRDVMVFANQSTVPIFVPIFHYRVAFNDTPLEQNYTCVRVEYINDISKVKVSYEPSNNTVSFFVKLPFMDTHFFVLGFFPGEPEETNSTLEAVKATGNGEDRS